MTYVSHRETANIHSKSAKYYNTIKIMPLTLRRVDYVDKNRLLYIFTHTVTVSLLCRHFYIHAALSSLESGLATAH